MTLESLYYVTSKEKNSKFSKALIYLKPIEKRCVFFSSFYSDTILHWLGVGGSCDLGAIDNKKYIISFNIFM